MNKLTKIGATALAGSLVAFSVNAADMSVSGGASITYNNSGADVTNDNITMGDSLNFSASGETDGGLMITSKMEIDGGAEDDHSITMAGDFGTLVFDGHGGSSALSAVDDKSPNAYEESWDVVSGADTNNINGNAQNNMFIYTSNDMNGVTATVSYVQSSAASVNSGMEFALAYSPEGMDGLTIGLAMGEDESAASTTVDEQVMYATYTSGPITVGMTTSDSDTTASTGDKEFTSAGVTYAVNDDFSVGYHVSTLETTDISTDADQESSGFSFSYTSGGMTLAGAVNDVENIGFAGTDDRDGAEIGVSFAF
ncbi:porin [Candidatus Pelagibacter sp. HIMB1542]|uniref:porin n=1 Tax=Candidatus Pelagibacter sp. HIMB1542 TaxID=3413346 RepID=UPI003F868C5A